MKMLRSLVWILPSSLVLGLMLSLLDGGTWWIGWIAYGVLLFLGSLALKALFPAEGFSHPITWILLLAFVLRLGLGVSFSYLLPLFGYDSETHQSGYIFNDSYQRDNQAWELASSDAPLTQAFDKSNFTDQYGGMLFLSAATYRLLSPEFHRPWLIILLASMTAVIGIGLTFRAAEAAWGKRNANLIAGILAFYPEAILQGSAQMREPFLMTFLAMMFQGLMIWKARRWKSLTWLAAGVLGLLLFSPGVAAVGILIFAVWIWLDARDIRIRWWLVAGVVVLVAAALLLLAGAVSGSLQVPGGPLANLFNWLRLSATWDLSQLEIQSGWIQNVFNFLPPPLHLPFIAIYGLTQPLLPAAVADITTAPLYVLNILRGLGWYALLPCLVYSLWSILKIPTKRERTAWLWLWFTAWGWILLSSFRAGGDQWDNPRYRVIFLLFQAALAAQAWFWQRATRDRWMGRILGVEVVFLVSFGYWYAARYTHWEAGQVHVFVIIALVAILSVVIILGGLIADRKRARRA